MFIKTGHCFMRIYVRTQLCQVGRTLNWVVSGKQAFGAVRMLISGCRPVST